MRRKLKVFYNQKIVWLVTPLIKLVGPSYKEVAAKYKGDNSAPDMLAKKIIKGGSGNWGPIPMPPHSLSNADALMLAKYILAM